MPFPARNCQRKIAVLQPIQSDNHPFEMINEPRPKTESYVMCFLFFLSSKSTPILVFIWFIAVALNASYEIKSYLLLNDLVFSCCLDVFLNNFFVCMFLSCQVRVSD